MKNRVVVAALTLGVLACGDPETNDRRGYTKAPLENPGLLVGGEDASPMVALGQPDLPRPRTDFDRPAAPGGEDRADGDAGAGEQDTASLASGVTQEQFDQGRELFAGAGGCQACHGANGSGSTLGPNLADDEWLHVSGPDVGELADVIREGVPQPQQYPAPMPPMGGASLNDEQVQALAGYIASLSQS